MVESEFTYDEVIEQGKPAEQGDLGRFDVWEITEKYRMRNNITGRDYHKRKYFVLDHEEEQVLRETMWDIPDDHWSDGVRDSAFGFKGGYMTAMEKINE